MKIDILTIFPEMFKGPFAESIIKRAVDNNLVKIKIHNLRKWSKDKHQSVDDRPYGGGKGMVMMVEPIAKALKTLKPKLEIKSKTILLSPRGRIFNQTKARELSSLSHLILICGHYEGVDERVSKLVDEEISIGDYILTGGEIPAMVIADAVARLIPGVLEKEATEKESFTNPKLLEAPQYTRPELYKKWRTPKVLLSGNPKLINEWRQKEALKKTKKMRPDLLKKQKFDDSNH